MGVSVELEQDLAAAGVGVEVEGLANGGQTENERGPQIRKICGKIRILRTFGL